MTVYQVVEKIYYDNGNEYCYSPVSRKVWNNRDKAEKEKQELVKETTNGLSIIILTLA
jgi:hypothetical protein